MEPLVAGVVQMTSTAEVAANLTAAERLTRLAAERGARLVVLPENFAFIGDGTAEADARRMALAEAIPGGPIVDRMGKLAASLGVTLVLGAMPEKSERETTRAHNTQVVLGPDGRLLGAYRKIHLFDVAFEKGPVFQESRSIAPGKDPVLLRLPSLALGLTTCYDLRFPELYRALALEGAEAFTVPSAFTLHTGKDHWEPLLRARAIENTAFVLAAAQWGTHSPGRASWGKSMILDPWGNILAGVSEGEGVAVTTLEPELLASVRRSLPSLTHVKLWPSSA